MSWALLSPLSSFGSSALSFAFSSKLQRQNQQWQEKMSNTAHQREVKDLRAAGLNPILSATGGAGASTPAGGGGAISAPDMDLNSAYVARKQLKNETRKTNSDIDVNNEIIRTKQYEGDLAHYNSAKAAEETRLLRDYGSSLRQAEIQSVLANTAKTLQDIESSKEITKATVDNYNSDTLLKIHSARGLKVESDWSEKHPILYGLGRASASVPIVGAAVGGGAYAIGKYQTRKKPVGFKTK